MNSDSRWLSESWELFTDPAIHNAYHTLLHSVTICLVRIQMCSGRHAEDRKGSGKLSWQQTLIWVWALIQMRVSCTSRQTRIAHYAQQSTLTDPLHQACSTNREKNNHDAATRQQPEGTTSSTWANRQTWLHFDLCESSQYSPNTFTRLSHNSTGHGVVGVNMVVVGCSSQQKQRKRRKSDFLSWKKYFEEQMKQINLEKKKQLENNQRVKERNVKTAIFNLRIFFSTKKKHRKREMQRMSCGPNQWQQNAHRPNSLNYVTTRSNSQESLRSRARSSTHVDFKR